MADVLAQTLRVASDRGSHTVVNVPEVTVFPATAPEMQDGSDGTGSRIVCLDQGGPASGEYREDWVLDTATASEPYSFVRVVTRGKRVDNLAPTVTATVFYQPSIAGAKRGAGSALSVTPTSDTQDFATDPADGLPWTAAKVNGQRWGWWLVAFLIPPSQFDSSVEAWAVDYRLEIWVPEAIPPEPPVEVVPDRLGEYTREILDDAHAYGRGLLMTGRGHQP